MMENTSQAPAAVPPGWMHNAVSGVHPLFEAAVIRRAFARLRKGLLRQNALLDAHGAMRYLNGFQTLIEKREYLAVLPEETVDVLVYLYFRTLDQWMAKQDDLELH